MKFAGIATFALTTACLAAGSATARRPIIGAEVMDDPTATQEKVDQWFRILADYQMPLARVMVPRSEQSLQHMDWFFRAAEKHHVGITATLGGTPSDENAHWIERVVKRYKDSPALDSWILVNEPGAAPHITDAAVSQFKVWLKNRYHAVEALNQAWGRGAQYPSFDQVEYKDPGPSFRSGSPTAFADWYEFNRDQLTSNLAWIAGEIRKVDAVHPTHVNPHALISNLAGNSQDLPAWRKFLSSLGASCHPSWHFGLLGRDEYALGVAYISDLIRGSSEPKPFWITELQGGPNTNSGNRPLSPTREDIAQWLWTGFGSGADRIIFWLLNNRSSGTESGEWSLLNLQDKPSERLTTAGKVAQTLNQNADFFQNASPVDAPVTVILSLDAMTLQENFAKTSPVTSTEKGKAVRLEARDRQAHLLAALSHYKTLLQLGIPVHIKHIHDFDWNAVSPTPQLVILPNVVALSDQQARNIETFVRNGNTALITGLTGAWDRNYQFTTVASKFPLEGILGATLADIHTLDANQESQVSLQKPLLSLPSSLWVGEIENRTAEVIGRQQGWVTAVRNKAGKGEVIWIPSLVDLGAWLGDNKPLAKFLTEVTEPFTRELPFRFVTQQKDCMLRVLRSGHSYVTIFTNGGLESQQFRIRSPKNFTPKVLWGDPQSYVSVGPSVALGPRATTVIEWTPESTRQ